MTRNDSDEVTRSIGKTACVATLVAVAFLVVGISGWLFGLGPNADAPDKFNQMVKIAKANTSNARIQKFFSIIDSEYVWRLSLSPIQLDAVIVDQQIAESGTVPDTFFTAFPLLWRPSKTEESRFFTTSKFSFDSRGPDGDHCAAMYDSEKQFLYVWFKNNF